MDESTDWAQIQWHELKEALPNLSDEACASLVIASAARFLGNAIEHGVFHVKTHGDSED